MTTVIIFALMVGAALSLYFNWRVLICAAPLMLLFICVSEIINKSAAGVVLLSTIVGLTALQTGYVGGALVRYIGFSPELKSVKD